MSTSPSLSASFFSTVAGVATSSEKVTRRCVFNISNTGLSDSSFSVSLLFDICPARITRAPSLTR